jgi:hypothetical protein
MLRNQPRSLLSSVNERKKEKKNAKAMKENKHCGLQSHYRQVGKEKNVGKT